MNAIPTLFSGNLSEALGWMLVHLLWVATVIAFVTGLLLLTLRHRSARLRYWTANAALAAILVAAIGIFCYYYNKPAPELPESPLGMLSAHLNPSAPTSGNLLPTPPDTEARNFTWVGFSGYFSRNLPLIVVIWLLGMSLFLLRLLGNIGYVFYLKRHLNFPAETFWDEMLQNLAQKSRIARTIGLVESALVRTPMVVGYFKPLILFPIGMINRLNPKEAEAILAHELAHILHRDYLFNILQSMVETLFYFHPAVWWLSSVIRHEREIAADDAAVRLTGNSMQYAKALVLVQDMAMHPLAFSPAFAGTRKRQLLQRIQHILKITPTKNFVMGKIIGTLTILLILIGLGYAQNLNTSFTKHSGKNDTEIGEGFSGLWEGKINEKKEVCLTLSHRSENHSWMHGDCYPTAEFSALPTEESTFTWTRPAGMITFKGKFENNEGYGRFEFKPDQSFADWLGQQGIEDIDDHAMANFFFANMNKEYVTSLKQAGYDKISSDDLQGLAIHGVDKKLIENYGKVSAQLGEGKPSIETMITFKIHEIDQDYLNEMAKIGFPKLTSEDIITAKIHEITPEFVRQCRDMGYPNLTFDDVVNFKIHEFTPEYMADLKKSGLTNLSADDAINMRIHEVTPSTIAEFRSMGFNNLTSDDIINLQIQEITPTFLKDMTTLGFKNLSVDDAVNLKIHEINADFLKGMNQIGFKDLSVDDAINLQIHEINADFLKNMMTLGFKNLSVDDAINLKIQDIDADFLKDMNKIGFKNLSIDDAVNLKIHDLDGEYLEQLKQAGFNNLTADEAINCKIHDVNPGQVAGFKKMGFDKISVDDAINLNIHDVTPEFIQKMRDKGFKDMSLEDYIELKIQFGDKLNR